MVHCGLIVFVIERHGAPDFSNLSIGALTGTATTATALKVLQIKWNCWMWKRNFTGDVTGVNVFSGNLTVQEPQPIDTAVTAAIV